MEQKVTILGAGSYATAIAQLLSEKEYEVLLYTNSSDEAFEINEYRTNKKIYENYTYPKNVVATTSINEAVEHSLDIVIALPSQHIRKVLRQIKNSREFGARRYINFSKGLEPDTNDLITDIIKEEILSECILGLAVVSGPSFAEEILEHKPTGLMVAAEDVFTRQIVMNKFNNYSYLRTYGTDDIIGVQISGAIKNVMAIAAGMCDGMELGNNGKALMVTRGLTELSRYALIKGAKPETLIGLAGIGDLMLTCNSDKSRNYTTGYKVGKGMSIEEAVSSSKTVVEGVRTLEALHKEIKENGIEMPITESLYNILFEGKYLSDEINKLFNRKLKLEDDEFSKTLIRK